MSVGIGRFFGRVLPQSPRGGVGGNGTRGLVPKFVTSNYFFHLRVGRNGGLGLGVGCSTPNFSPLRRPQADWPYPHNPAT